MKVIKHPSPNFNERTLPVDSIIIHYTDMASAAEALAWLSHPISQVSAHYLIDQEGQIYRLVEEEKRAWHAGESYWQGCANLNSCSIGIELDNPGPKYGYTPFPEPQIDALINLCKEICARWKIPPFRILGHSDIAPRRKEDPGHLFPWDRLAKEGLGLWPSSAWIASSLTLLAKTTGERHCEAPEGSRQSSMSTNEESIIEALAKIGYETISLTDTILAFQRHFQPHKLDGIADDETLSLLRNLLYTARQ